MKFLIYDLAELESFLTKVFKDKVTLTHNGKHFLAYLNGTELTYDIIRKEVEKETNSVITSYRIVDECETDENKDLIIFTIL